MYGQASIHSHNNTSQKVFWVKIEGKNIFTYEETSTNNQRPGLSNEGPQVVLQPFFQKVAEIKNEKKL